LALDLSEREGPIAEVEKSIRNVFLALVLVSILYWISFLAFLQDPRRELFPAARRFVETIDQLESEHEAWRAGYLANIVQVIRMGSIYLDRLKQESPVLYGASVDLGVQLKIDDRLLTSLMNESNADSYGELVAYWLTKLRDLQRNRIVHEAEVLDIYASYYVLNQTPGWLTRVTRALDAPASAVAIIPSELDGPPWSDLHDRGQVLFADFDDLQGRIHDLQTIYQGPITDRMQEKTLRGGTGIWLRNLDSGRSIAREITSHEPDIRLPLLGEHLTGRWAFYIAPALYLIAVRYLRLLAQRARRARKMRTKSTQEHGHPTASEFPHILNLLTSPDSDLNRRLNRALAGLILLFPLSTCIPIGVVSLSVTTFPLKLVIAVALGCFVLVLRDSLALLGIYLRET